VSGINKRIRSGYESLLAAAALAFTILIVSTALALVWSNAVFYGMIAIAVVSQISTFQRLHFASRAGGRGEC
jgi:ABC-type multidrug transport system permease subunit